MNECAHDNINDRRVAGFLLEVAIWKLEQGTHCQYAYWFRGDRLPSKGLMER